MTKIVDTCPRSAIRVSCRGSALLLVSVLAVGCAAVPVSDEDAPATPAAVISPPPTVIPAPLPPPVPPAPAAPAPPPILSFDEAVSNAAHAVFRNAPPPDAGNVVVIDPLVDGMTGYQSKATKSIQDRILGVAKNDFPQYLVQRITSRSLGQQPRVLIGTFTPVNASMKTSGEREAYRFCLVMADLKTGKIVAKSVSRARLDDVDASPTAAFSDSPVWTDDPSVQAYIATCQASKVGDPIKPEYVEGILAAALVSEAGNAYEEGHYEDALNLYRTAQKTPAGDQLRVYNGIYLSLSKLGRTDPAAAAFRDLVDFGIRRKRLAVKFLFRPGSVRFASDNKSAPNYPMWLQQIASQSVVDKVCLQITGHTSPTGPAAMNDSLSLLRAEYVQTQIEGDAPLLKKRTVAAGMGSRENLVGTGRDDASDELDRRVELKPIDPCS